MSGRPTSSAGGSRPFTASAFRTSSARPPTSAGAFDRDHQYTYDNAYIEEEEEEESDTEDLFAFLPPSTADQERDLEKQRAADLSRISPDYANVFANAVPSDVPHLYIQRRPLTPGLVSPLKPPAPPDTSLYQYLKFQ
ncbi:hypothetical protein BDR07DRAFT_1489857 [Suillus spraguei]|nr:hypothetical protein BDR07DRAFT_1489857 [Suillus spraguei]